MRLRRRRAPSAASNEDLSARVHLLHSLSIFEGASDESLERLAAAMQETEVEAGTEVIREGHLPSHFFIVLSGGFDVLSSGERGGVPSKVNSLGPGDYFGEIGLVEGMPSTATVRATTRSRFHRIRDAEFLAVVRSSPALSDSFIDRVTGRLARTHASYRPAAMDDGKAAATQGSLRELESLLPGVEAARGERLAQGLLQLLVSTARRFFDAESCSVALLEGEALVFEAADGRGAANIVGKRLPASEGVVGWVVRSGQPLAHADVGSDERFAASFARASGYAPRSLLALPLESDGRIIGVIEVLDGKRLREPGDPETRLLKALASETARAATIARVLQQLSALNDEERRELLRRAAGNT